MPPEMPSVTVPRARRADVQAELLRQFAQSGSQQTEEMARQHFAATPLYLATVLQTGVMPARVRIIRGRTLHESTRGVLRASWREAIVEDDLP